MASREERHFSTVVFLCVQTIPQGDPQTASISLSLSLQFRLRFDSVCQEHGVGDMALPAYGLSLMQHHQTRPRQTLETPWKCVPSTPPSLFLVIPTPCQVALSSRTNDGSQLLGESLNIPTWKPRLITLVCLCPQSLPLYFSSFRV